MGTDIEKLQGILKEDPSNFQARRELAFLLSDSGFIEEALSNLIYLAKYFPEDAELFYNLGILYEKLKDYNSAKESYLTAIKISPQDDFYYNLGEVLVTLKEWDEAINAFNTVLKSDSNDGNCYFNLGLCYFYKDEMNLATDNFQKAVNCNSQDIFAHFYLGYIYQNSGLTNFAIECYNKVLAISPDYSWAYFNLALISFKNDNLEEAKEYLLKTVFYNKNDVEAYKILTKIFIKLNEVEEIISILETRLNDSLNGDLCYILAQVYKLVGDLDNYIKFLELALEERYTLTYPPKIVKKEFKKVRALREIQVSEVEEYSPETEDEQLDMEMEDV